jgi:plasmid stabilization system protein ParE
MSYTYVLHEYAQQDYESSFQWYLERSLPAAENFVAAVDDTLKLICDNPSRWRNQYKNYYELNLKKYPFAIVYSIEPDKELIVVIAIYHHKRNPKKKFRRIRASAPNPKKI